MIKYMAVAVAVAVAVSGGGAVAVAVPVAGLTKRFLNQCVGLRHYQSRRRVLNRI